MPEVDSVRIDVWLDVACLMKTRSQAQSACKGGKVKVNRRRAKPHREIRVGDEIEIAYGQGHRKIVEVAALAERHVSRREARELYEDHTPPPTPEELELRRLAKMTPGRRGSQRHGAPDKRERRRIRRVKEDW